MKVAVKAMSKEACQKSWRRAQIVDSQVSIGSKFFANIEIIPLQICAGGEIGRDSW